MCNAWNHLSSCNCGWGGENYSSNNFRVSKLKSGGYLWDFGKNFCTPTSCPTCSKEVYFIRHNGGSAWFDSLGYPWPKHACFDNQLTIPNKADMNTSEFIHRALILACNDDAKPVLGIIDKVKYISEKLTEIRVISETGANRMYIPSNIGLFMREIIGSVVFLFRDIKQLFFLRRKLKIAFRDSP